VTGLQLKDAALTAPLATKGRVTLIGAGPGDPDLLTVKALRLLQAADVVLYDTLVSAEVLALVRAGAEKIHAGKKGYGDQRPQDEINARMTALALAGRHVLRLKGGDPMIFGRAGDEIEACRAAGVPVDVVPGITSAQGAAARLGVSLTHRHEVRRLQYVTGHDATGGLPETLDWGAIADPQATTVVYMPRRTIGELARRVLAVGMDPATPALVVVNATRPDEQVVVSTVGEVGAAVAAMAGTEPMLVLLGAGMRRGRV
jgi:uroporphyrin-III C-methyltransferase / precorrin-2 dehydrogenase / sirohydrochlorin ferrochelatase